MLVVTGMHRSGTSAVAGLLDKLGLEFGPPAEMLPTDRWNARGYMERWDVFRINSELITGSDRLARLWKTPYEERGRLHKMLMMVAKARYLTMPSLKRLERRARTRQGELTSIARQLDGLAVKDPRFCLLIGTWSHYGNVERVLFSYRNPEEVARSLNRREGIPQALAYRFWLYHVDTFFREVDRLGAEVEIVDFTRLFDPELQMGEARRLFRFSGRSFDKDFWRERVCVSLDSRLRHHRSEARDLPAAVEDLVAKIERRRAASPVASET